VAALVLDATPYAVARSYTTLLDATASAASAGTSCRPAASPPDPSAFRRARGHLEAPGHRVRHAGRAGPGRSSPPPPRTRSPTSADLSASKSFEQGGLVHGPRVVLSYVFLGACTQRLTRWPLPPAQPRRSSRSRTYTTRRDAIVGGGIFRHLRAVVAMCGHDENRTAERSVRLGACSQDSGGGVSWSGGPPRTGARARPAPSAAMDSRVQSRREGQRECRHSINR
jgi:hypothetical protein